MKRLLLINGVIVLNLVAMTPPLSPERGSAKRALVYPDSISEEEQNVQVLTPTSPSKPAFMSPEKRSKRSFTQEPQAGHSTEAVSDAERRIAKIPTITRVRNNFNYPIMISYPSYPRPTTVVLYEGEKEELKGNIKLSAPDRIMINANNRNHIFEYSGNKFMQHINKTDSRTIEIDAPKAEIIVDKLGDIFIKAVSE